VKEIAPTVIVGYKPHFSLTIALVWAASPVQCCLLYTLPPTPFLLTMKIANPSKRALERDFWVLGIGLLV